MVRATRQHDSGVTNENCVESLREPETLARRLHAWFLGGPAATTISPNSKESQWNTSLQRNFRSPGPRLVRREGYAVSDDAVG